MQKDKPLFKQLAKRHSTLRPKFENEDYADCEFFYQANGITSDNEYLRNSFDPFMFNVLQSNMDLQFIVEEYSCAAYIIDYVNKTDKCISNLQPHIEIINEHP